MDIKMKQEELNEWEEILEIINSLKSKLASKLSHERGEVYSMLWDIEQEIHKYIKDENIK